jgi:hypothetical protein
VEATLAEGLAARLLGCTRLPELDNVGHKKGAVSNGAQLNILPRKHTEKHGNNSFKAFFFRVIPCASVANWGWGYYSFS